LGGGVAERHGQAHRLEQDGVITVVLVDMFGNLGLCENLPDLVIHFAD